LLLTQIKKVNPGPWKLMQKLVRKGTSEMKKEIKSLKEQVSGLQEENKELREEMKKFQEENRALQQRLIQSNAILEIEVG